MWHFMFHSTTIGTQAHSCTRNAQQLVSIHSCTTSNATHYALPVSTHHSQWSSPVSRRTMYYQLHCQLNHLAYETLTTHPKASTHAASSSHSHVHSPSASTGDHHTSSWRMIQYPRPLSSSEQADRVGTASP